MASTNEMAQELRDAFNAFKTAKGRENATLDDFMDVLRGERIAEARPAEKEKELSPFDNNPSGVVDNSPMQDDLLETAMMAINQDPVKGIQYLKAAGESKDLLDKFKRDFSGEAMAVDAQVALDEKRAGRSPSLKFSQVEKGVGEQKSPFDIEGLRQAREMEKSKFETGQSSALFNAKLRIKKLTQDILNSNREYRLTTDKSKRNFHLDKMEFALAAIREASQVKGLDEDVVKSIVSKLEPLVNQPMGGSPLK